MLKNIFRKIDRSFKFIEDWSLFTAVSIALISAMANVILRKTTSDFSLYWSDEVVRKVIFFSTYVGCISAIRSRALIKIDALPQLLPGLKKPLTLFSHLAVIVFAIFMIYLGGLMAITMFHDEYAVTSTLRIPEWYFYSVLPIMGLMMLIRTIIVFYEDLFDNQSITGGE